MTRAALLLALVTATGGCGVTVDTASRPDARGAALPDAAAPVDAIGDAVGADADPGVDDLSRCRPDALVYTQRSQLSAYAVHYDDTIATLENYPVSQFRPVVGASGWGAAFKDNQLAIRVRVPAGYVATDPLHVGFIRVAEAPGEPVTSHHLCVTAHACDFTCPNAGDTAPGINFTIAAPAMPATQSFARGEVFWINVEHTTPQGSPACPPDRETCGVLVDFASPNRY